MPHTSSVEMRHSVATPSYLLRRALNNFFSRLTTSTNVMPTSVEQRLPHISFPSSPMTWIPLYTMVTFRPDISYHTARQKAEWQNMIISRLGWWSSILFITGLSFGVLKKLDRRIMEVLAWALPKWHGYYFFYEMEKMYNYVPCMKIMLYFPTLKYEISSNSLLVSHLLPLWIRYLFLTIRSLSIRKWSVRGQLIFTRITVLCELLRVRTKYIHIGDYPTWWT